jgi:integrase
MRNQEKRGRNMRKRTGYLTKRGDTFYAVWVVAGKRFVKTTRQTDRKKAQVELNRIMRPFIIGDEATTLENIGAAIAGRRNELVKLDDEKNPPLSIAEAWDVYRVNSKQADLSAGAVQNYAAYWNAFRAWLEKKHPECKRLCDVTLNLSEEYAGHLTTSNLTARTCNAHRAFLRAFWNVLTPKAKLVHEFTTPKGYRTRNPWAMLQKRPEVSQGRRRLSVAELQNVCSTAQGELRTLLCLGLYLGARLGDCALMRWEAANFRERKIYYTPRKTSRKRPEALKTNMHIELFGLLSETPLALRTGYIMPTTAKTYLENGANYLTDAIQEHFNACGIETTEARQGAGKKRVTIVGFHSLRHSSVSLIRDAGAAASVSQAIAGHSSAEIHKLYTHADEGAMRKAIESLPAVMGGAVPALPPHDPEKAFRAAVRAAADRLGADTWESVKTELLKLTTEGAER